MSGQQLPETAQSQGYYPSQLTPSQGQYPSQQVPSQGLNTVHALTHDGVQVEINLQSGYLSWGSYSYQISSLDGFTQDGISVGIQVPKTDYNYTLTYSAPAQASNSISSNGQQPIYSQPSDRSCSVRYATPMDITPANTPHPGSYLDRDATPMDLDIATTPRAGSYQDQDTTPTAPIRSSGQDDGLVPDEESSEDGSYQDRDTTPTAPIRSSGQDDGVVSDEESSEDGPIPDISVPPVYDPMWVQNENYDPSIVWAQTAKMHFEVLFTKNVIIVSDTLVCDVTYRKGKLKQIGKVVLRVLELTPPPTYPNLEYYIQGFENDRKTIKACKGTEQITKELKRKRIRASTNLSNNMHVFRGNLDLGTLKYVKQAYQHWVKIKDKEAVALGIANRLRRAPKNSEKTFKKGILCKKQTDGSFIREAIQDQFDPCMGPPSAYWKEKYHTS